MKIQVDKNGYIENYVIVGESSSCNIEVEEPEGFSPDFYQAWKYDGEKIIFDEDRAQELRNKYAKDGIRENRMRKCFPIVNRGQFWYDTLTEDQKTEIREWYKKWLDAPETGVEPEDLDFI